VASNPQCQREASGWFHEPLYVGKSSQLAFPRGNCSAKQRPCHERYFCVMVGEHLPQHRAAFLNASKQTNKQTNKKGIVGCHVSFRALVCGLLLTFLVLEIAAISSALLIDCCTQDTCKRVKGKPQNNWAMIPFSNVLPCLRAWP